LAHLIENSLYCYCSGKTSWAWFMPWLFCAVEEQTVEVLHSSMCTRTHMCVCVCVCVWVMHFEYDSVSETMNSTENFKFSLLQCVVGLFFPLPHPSMLFISRIVYRNKAGMPPVPATIPSVVCDVLTSVCSAHTSWHNGNILRPMFRRFSVESWLGHQLSLLVLCVFFAVPPGKYQHIASIRPWPLSLKHFPFCYSLIILPPALCSLKCTQLLNQPWKNCDVFVMHWIY
jgi:hypothetical protein